MYRLKGFKVFLALIVLASVFELHFFNFRQHAEASTPKSFKIAILPDTQMYARYKAEIFNAQTEWIRQYRYSENIAFTTHLGDIVDQSDKEEQWINADKAMRTLDDAKIPYGYVAGNHDIQERADDDKRNDRDKWNTLFLKYFKPASRMANKDYSGFGGASPSGYSSYYTFDGAGKKFLVLCLDWRAGDTTLSWANEILNKNPALPTILVTHQMLNTSSDGKTAIMTDNGQKMWDRLVKGNDQIFLTLSGHHHGSAHMVRKNDQGRDVLMSLIDYQGYYMGGNGVMRTLNFDLEAGTIAARTFSPWVMNIPQSQRDKTYDVEEIKDENNAFTINMNFKERFKGIWDSQNVLPQAAPVTFNASEGKTLHAQLKAADANSDPLIYSITAQPKLGQVKMTDQTAGTFAYTPNAGQSGTDTFTFKVNDGFGDSVEAEATIKVRKAAAGNGELAHWLFQKPSDGTFNVKDITGNGNDLYLVNMGKEDVKDIYVDWSSDHSMLSKSSGSIEFASAGKSPKELSYLRTRDEASLNKEEFRKGYTVEAFFRIRENFDAAKNGWMSMLARGASGRNAGKSDGESQEPIATLSISTLKELQWASYPTNQNTMKTSWSGEQFFNWIHVAVVNDTRSTKMYVNGSPVLRNDEGGGGESLGIAAAKIDGKYAPWIVGGKQYNNVFEKGFNGWISEMRITDHALDFSEFLINENEPPVTKNREVTTDQNTPYTQKLEGSDPDAGLLTYSIVAQPNFGKVELNGQTGEFTYTPNLDYKGTDRFTYRAYDGKTYSNESEVKITINGNTAPQAYDDTFQVDLQQNVQGTLRAADTEKDKLVYEILKQPAKGILKLTDASTGQFSYTPDPNESGIDYFTFQVTDGKNKSTEATIIIEIGSAPRSELDWKISNLEYDIAENQVLEGTVSDSVYNRRLKNIQQIQLLRLPENGTVTVTDQTYGNFVYTPHPGTSGLDLFTFRIGDGQKISKEGIVFIRVRAKIKLQVTPLNLQTTMNRTVQGRMEVSGAKPSEILYSVVEQPKSGKLTVTDSVYGTFMYEPNQGFVGNDTFTYKAAAGEKVSEIGKVRIRITDPRIPPTERVPFVDPPPNQERPNVPSVEKKPEASKDGEKESDAASENETPVQEPKTPQPTISPTIPAAPFKDVSGHWAQTAIERIHAAGMIKGYSNDTFRPDLKMTRAEFVTLLLRGLGQEASTNNPIFKDMQGHWAKEGVQKAVELGIVEGKGGALFDPQRLISREEAAVMIARGVKIPASAEDTTSFIDQSSISKWAVSSVHALANHQIILGSENRSFLPAKSISRAEAAVLLSRLMDKNLL